MKFQSRGSKSSKGLQANFHTHFSWGLRWSILRGLNLSALSFLTLVDVGTQRNKPNYKSLSWSQSVLVALLASGLVILILMEVV